jgi:hypothetical protein
MTLEDVVANVLAGEHGDFVREAVAIIRRVRPSRRHRSLRGEVAIPTREPLGVRARGSHTGPLPRKGDPESFVDALTL